MGKITHVQRNNSNLRPLDKRYLYEKVQIFEKILSGRTTKKIQRFYIWSVFLGLTAISIIAQILFPADFSLLSHTISQQGSILQNPIGSIIWRIGVVINGFAHIPHILYIEHHLSAFNRKKAVKMRWIGIISAIGFSLVGLFSIEFGIFHYIFALIAFWGYFFTANLSFNILNSEIRQNRLSTQQSSRVRKFSQYFSVYFNLSGALCLCSFIINYFFFNKEVWPPLEWNYLIAICIWLLFWPFIVKILEQ